MYIGFGKGATSWEWQIGRLYGGILLPSFWLWRCRPWCYVHWTKEEDL